MSGSRDTVMLAMQRLVSRWAVRDALGASRLFADTVDLWVSPIPRAPWPRAAANPREVESFFIAVTAAVEPVRITARGLVVDRSAAVFMGRMRARVPAGGPLVDHDFVLSIAVDGDLIRQFRLYLDTRLLDAAFAGRNARHIPRVSP
ncbi:hypothetical protein V5P93_000538 [Actinokineospora auranticolor]|uniref:nuclear transport factor 2 family protein n=1 Tax=Actinokineospora auranticolor TaxID=155976 RepID=UPI0011AFE8EC|nr:hypothetical protein [Actinokineospora auranticolor]